MKLYEIEEAHDVIKHINGILLMFGTTKKSNKIIIEYLQNLILELQDQNMIDEVQAQSEEEVSFDEQINFLQYLIDTLEAKEYNKEPTDKSTN